MSDSIPITRRTARVALRALLTSTGAGAGPAIKELQEALRPKRRCSGVRERLDFVLTRAERAAEAEPDGQPAYVVGSRP